MTELTEDVLCIGNPVSCLQFLLFIIIIFFSIFVYVRAASIICDVDQKSYYKSCFVSFRNYRN